MRSQLKIKDEVKAKLAHRQNIVFVSTGLAIIFIGGMLFFLYGNFGSSQESVASPTNSSKTNQNQSTLSATLNIFTASLVSNSRTVIKWETSAELTNAFFSLERSINGTDFEIINEQQAADTFNLDFTYLYVDQHPVTGLNFYRLKTIDNDGNTSYSQTQLINKPEDYVLYNNHDYNNQLNVDGASNYSETTKRINALREINIQPNPCTGTFALTNIATTGNHNFALVNVFDTRGELVKSVNIKSGTNPQIDISNQPNGNYIVSVIDANDNKTTKHLIKQ